MSEPINVGKECWLNGAECYGQITDFYGDDRPCESHCENPAHYSYFMNTNGPLMVDMSEVKINVGYCRDCKWWAEPTFIVFQNGDPKTTRVGSPEDNWRECLKVPFDDLDDSRAPLLAMVQSNDGCSIGDDTERLFTKPDFGCVQFEAKT